MFDKQKQIEQVHVNFRFLFNLFMDKMTLKSMTRNLKGEQYRLNLTLEIMSKFIFDNDYFVHVDILTKYDTYGLEGQIYEDFLMHSFDSSGPPLTLKDIEAKYKKSDIDRIFEIFCDLYFYRNYNQIEDLLIKIYFDDELLNQYLYVQSSALGLPLTEEDIKKNF